MEPARSHKRATRSGNRRWYGVGSDHHCFFFLLSCHWDYFFGLCTVPIASPSLRRGLHAQARMRLAPWYPSFFQQNSWKQVTYSLVSKYKMCILSENRLKDPLRGIDVSQICRLQGPRYEYESMGAWSVRYYIWLSFSSLEVFKRIFCQKVWVLAPTNLKKVGAREPTAPILTGTLGYASFVVRHIILTLCFVS